ncbi:MAG: hypothetical protein JSS43_15415, partial [Proteobacteria bacterium]|nr:hypothetical protein [Pseudomonadota bacterium]
MANDNPNTRPSNRAVKDMKKPRTTITKRARSAGKLPRISYFGEDTDLAERELSWDWNVDVHRDTSAFQVGFPDYGELIYFHRKLYPVNVREVIQKIRSVDKLTPIIWDKPDPLEPIGYILSEDVYVIHTYDYSSMSAHVAAALKRKLARDRVPAVHVDKSTKERSNILSDRIKEIEEALSQLRINSIREQVNSLENIRRDIDSANKQPTESHQNP